MPDFLFCSIRTCAVNDFQLYIANNEYSGNYSGHYTGIYSNTQRFLLHSAAAILATTASITEATPTNTEAAAAITETEDYEKLENLLCRHRPLYGSI